MSSLYSKFKAIEKSINNRKYHRISRSRALAALKAVESGKGKIDAKSVKKCDDYAREILGSIEYSPWLYFYSVIAGGFKEGWIPNNYYGSVVVPALKGAYGKCSSLKALTFKLFKSELFPDLLYHANGLWFDVYYQIVPEHKVKKTLFRSSDQIVFKRDNSGRGKAVYPLFELEFEPKKIAALGNGVVQQFIQQHSFFNDLVKGPVATIRITTITDDSGQSAIKASYLKLGRSKDKVVSFDSEIMIPINISNGALYAYGFLPNFKMIYEHPDTRAVFEGQRIPHYKKCLDAVLELQSKLPQIRCIGWDVTLDKEGHVKILEWNGTHNGIIVSEAAQGPCFAGLNWEKIWCSH